jgi:hypothetical protein
VKQGMPLDVCRDLGSQLVAHRNMVGRCPRTRSRNSRPSRDPTAPARQVLGKRQRT